MEGDFALGVGQFAFEPDVLDLRTDGRVIVNGRVVATDQELCRAIMYSLLQAWKGQH